MSFWRAVASAVTGLWFLWFRKRLDPEIEFQLYPLSGMTPGIACDAVVVVVIIVVAIHGVCPLRFVRAKARPRSCVSFAAALDYTLWPLVCCLVGGALYGAMGVAALVVDCTGCWFSLVSRGCPDTRTRHLSASVSSPPQSSIGAAIASMDPVRDVVSACAPAAVSAVFCPAAAGACFSRRPDGRCVLSLLVR